MTYQKKIQERGYHNPAGVYLKDAVFGVNDGVVSMLALVAALSAASLSPSVIIIAGLAEAAAGAISMAIGSYISTKSKMEFLKNELKRERHDVEHHPAKEKKHLISIYKQRGFKGAELERVINKIMSNRKVWTDVMQREELGFSRTVLENPLRGGIVMFFSFLIASFAPLLPYFFGSEGIIAFASAGFNGIVLLFLAGMGRTYFTGRHRIKSGLEMVIIGIIATALSYGIGAWISKIFT